MMMEQHYDEEVLAGFLAEPAESAARDRHLAGCSLCKGTLESLRGTATLLADARVWERPSFSSTPRRETLTFLREVQRTMGDEDAAADVYIKQLLSGSRDTWAAKLAQHPEWRTAGVVRKLIAATDRYNFNAPLDAVELTRIATSVAESLTPSVTCNSLISDAWREHAYALLVVGSYSESMAAVSRAEGGLAAASGFARARTTLMRALILRSMENWTEAATMAREAAADFYRHGDLGKYCASRITEGIVLYDSSQYREGLSIYAGLGIFHSQMAPETLAVALHNEGLCYREIGDFEQAEKCFLKAIELFEQMHSGGLRAKAHWHLARLFMRQARYGDALKILNPLREEFQELGMSHDLACASVDTAESLLALGRPDEVAALCRCAIDYFRVAGLSGSTGAMTALAYLQETAANGLLTIDEVTHVRVFVERLAQSPEVPFVSLA
jgi:tetratricopeptide (TPR) repeat protein